METPSLQGKPSRKAAAAAVKAHLQVIKGESLKSATSSALEDAPSLGGQERRFVAFAARELVRHMRRIDSFAKALGRAPADFSLKEDLAIVRYVLWRHFVTLESWPRIRIEVGLPGPVRPRSIPDDLLEELATAAPPLQAFSSEEERLATWYSLPAWLSGKLFQGFPRDEWEPLFQALNRELPLIFRMRAQGALVDQLASQGIPLKAIEDVPQAFVLEDESRAIFDTPAMKSGQLQVMDLGSQLIARLCRPEDGFSGARIADICAGAGGKTLYLADLVGPSGKIWASDASSKRLEEGRRRVKASWVEFLKKPRMADADGVLIDAPCSGTGTLAREPDQKWRLKADGLKELLKTQATLLDDCARAMKPGAILVYGTCSLLQDENEAQMEAFLARHSAFKLLDASNYVPARFVKNGYLKVLPHLHSGAGFFGARLVKG